MQSVPDRPFATLTQYELDRRIQHNRDQQAFVVGGRTDAARRVLRQLKGDLAELIAERNWRSDMQQLPF